MGASAGVTLWLGDVELANSSANGNYSFWELPLALYTIKSGGRPGRNCAHHPHLEKG
jgi:hypothetical protein